MIVQLNWMLLANQSDCTMYSNNCNNYMYSQHSDVYFVFIVHVIIATPGRIFDLMKKELANMKECHMVIMDEVSELNIYIQYY